MGKADVSVAPNASAPSATKLVSNAASVGSVAPPAPVAPAAQEAKASWLHKPSIGTWLAAPSPSGADSSKPVGSSIAQSGVKLTTSGGDSGVTAQTATNASAESRKAMPVMSNTLMGPSFFSLGGRPMVRFV